MFKIEVEDGRGSWSDVRGDDGSVLTFATEDAARAALAGAFPYSSQMEKYAGGKRTRGNRIPGTMTIGRNALRRDEDGVVRERYIFFARPSPCPEPLRRCVRCPCPRRPPVLHPDNALSVPNIPSIISTARIFLAMIDLLLRVPAFLRGPAVRAREGRDHAPRSILRSPRLLQPHVVLDRLDARDIARHDDRRFSAATELTNPLS